MLLLIGGVGCNVVRVLRMLCDTVYHGIVMPIVMSVVMPIVMSMIVHRLHRPRNTKRRNYKGS